VLEATELSYDRYKGYLNHQLQGDWATYAKIAEYFVHKVRPEDIEDFRHDLILELARVKAKYRPKGKLLTEAGMMRVCSYELSAYWDKEKLRGRGMLVDCGGCSKEQRRQCRVEDLYSQCRKVKRFVSLSDTITDDGKELYEVLADDKALDLDAWADTRAALWGLPRKLILIAYKKIDGLPLSPWERQYLRQWRKDGLAARAGLCRGRRKENPPWYDMDQTILALLKRNGGMSKRDLYNRLGMSVAELDRRCAPLIRQGLVAEIKREFTFGRSCTPLLVAVQPGQPLPTPPKVKTEQTERIRHAYFVEKRKIKQIAREMHHSVTTVRKAIRPALAELVP